MNTECPGCCECADKLRKEVEEYKKANDSLAAFVSRRTDEFNRESAALKKEIQRLSLDNLSMSEKLQGTYDVPEGGAQ